MDRFQRTEISFAENTDDKEDFALPKKHFKTQ